MTRWLLHTPTGQSLLILLAIILALRLLHRWIGERASYDEWVLWTFCAGIVATTAGSMADWSGLLLAGFWLWVPSFFVILGGFAFRIDETVRDIRRFWRKR